MRANRSKEVGDALSDSLMLAGFGMSDAPVYLSDCAMEALAINGLALSASDLRALASRRAEALIEVERIEFGEPALALVVDELASSPFLTQDGLVVALAELQDAFYAVRDEMDVDVPDEEIAAALRACFDELEGDALAVTALLPQDVMRRSNDFVCGAEGAGAYRIEDDEGNVYAFDSCEWDYDETASGWNGERWADDHDD